MHIASMWYDMSSSISTVHCVYNQTYRCRIINKNWSDIIHLTHTTIKAMICYLQEMIVGSFVWFLNEDWRLILSQFTNVCLMQMCIGWVCKRYVAVYIQEKTHRANEWATTKLLVCVQGPSCAMWNISFDSISDL